MQQQLKACVKDWQHDTDHKGAYVAYNVHLEYGSNCKWVVKHRFSEFDNLNSVLKIHYGNLPALPKKTLFPVKSNDDINTRSNGLSYYVTELVKRSDVYANSNFNTFFDIEKNIPKSGVRT